MTFDGTNPDAQGTNAADPQNQTQPAPVEQQQPSDAGGSSGIQKRFDELTAKIYEKDERILQMQSQMTELLARYQSQPHSAPAPQPQEDFSEVDPSVRKMMESYFNKFEQKFGSMVGQLGQTVYQSEAARAAQQMGVQDAWTVQRAQALAADWRRQGLPFIPEDAVKYALGEKAVRDAQQAFNQPRDNRGRFAGSPGMNGANPPPQISPPVHPSQKPLPQNYDQLSPDEQIRLLSQRGVDDVPL